VLQYISSKLSPNQEKRESFALFAMGIFTIIPWHIMMCRWALDCNIIVPFLIFSTALLIKANEDNRFLPLAAFFLGLSLYSYVLPWMVMPIIAAGYIIYLLISKSLKPNKFVFLYFVILLIMATPLFLFILVNSGIINEIKTPYFSVPLLPHYRTYELSLNPMQIMRNFSKALQLFLKQIYGRVSNATPFFGLFYKFSGIPIVVGVASSIQYIVRSKENKHYVVLIILHFSAGIVLCSILTDMVFNRANIILFPLTMFLIIGLYEIIIFFKDLGKYSVLTLYICAFLAFIPYYLTIHDDRIADSYGEGMQYCVEYINSEGLNTYPVNIISGINYAQLLYYAKYPTDDFLNTYVYDYSDPDRPTWKTIQSFGKYNFSYGARNLSSEKAIYICGTNDEASIEFMKANNMEISYFTTVAAGIYNP
jgi:hypothetical protein